MTPRAGRRSRYQAASTRLPTATRPAASTGPISWFRRSGATRIRCSSSVRCATSRTCGSTATTSATTRGATRRLHSTPLARWCPARTTTSWFASTIRCGGRATTSSRGAWPIGGTTAGSSVTCGSKPSPRRAPYAPTSHRTLTALMSRSSCSTEGRTPSTPGSKSGCGRHRSPRPTASAQTRPISSRPTRSRCSTTT